MKIVKPSFKIVTKDDRPLDGKYILQFIEQCGRTCYKSEKAITDDSALAFVKSIIKNGHESVLEHAKVTVRVICDRGVTHEIVRHRIASYSQESTRYVCYDGEHHEMEVIEPFFWPVSGDGHHKRTVWLAAMIASELAYKQLLDLGATAQEARSVLPNSLKTEIVMTMNLREWRHFFKLRTSVKAHPQMREIACPMLAEFKRLIPVVFDDITVNAWR